jgi:type IV secretion system protein VirB1
MHKLALSALALGSAISATGAFAADAEDFHALTQRCAPNVSSHDLAPIVKVESGFRPYAIGVVGGRLERQPANKAEAVATVTALQAAGLKFAAGIGQIFVGNWKANGLSSDSVFEPCQNIRAAAAIYKDCYDRALAEYQSPAIAKPAAYSCYYSNDFVTGYKAEANGQPSYVQKVLNSAAELQGQAVTVAQPIAFIPNKPNGQPAKPAKATVEKPPPPELVDFTARAASTPAVAASASPAVATDRQADTASEAAAVAAKDLPSPYVYMPQSGPPQAARSAMVY